MSLQDPLLSSSVQQGGSDGEKDPPKPLYIRAMVATVVLFAIAVFLYLLIYTASNTWDYIGPPQAQLCGPIEGLWVGGDRPGDIPLAKFLGIPYGAPPTKWNRWQPAQPAYPDGTCWDDTYDVSWPGRICYQFGYGPNIYPMQNQSEDCLNLDVWTRNLDNANSNDSSKLHPVLFWIYGGSNVFGSQDSYPDVENWAINGEVCLISPSYRLNIFGYLATAELSSNDTRGTSGNYGITDLQEALRWVKKNARAFGCNPDSVTLFGQSSGGTNILALLSSPDSQGLFHRAISLSASNNISMNADAAATQNKDIVTALCPGLSDTTQILNCLHSATPEQLLNVTPPAWADTSFWPSSPDGLFNVPGLVIVDGVTVTTDWQTAAATAVVPDISLILQNTRDELELFYQSANQSVLSMTPDEYHQFLIDNFYPWRNDSSVGEALNTQYLSVTNQNVQRSYYDLQTDIGIFCPQVQVGLLYANANPTANVYVSVAWQPPSKPVRTFPNEPPIPDPFHLWDWIAATGAWDFFLVNSEAYVGSYSPSGVDSAYGAMLRKEIYQFIQDGTIPGQKRVNDASSGSYYVIQHGTENRDGNVTSVLNFRSDYCQTLTDNLLNPDSRFWWVN